FAKLQISTAGSDANEAELDALTFEAAEQLKQVVAVKQSMAGAAAHPSVSLPSVSPDYTFEVGLRTLILGAVTSRVVAFVGAVIGTIAYFQVFGAGSSWFSRYVPESVRKHFRFPGWDGMDQYTEMIPDSGISGFIADFWFSENLGKSILFAIVGVLITIVIYVFRYYDFRLKRTGDALSTSHGLMTYQQGGLRRTRIQALKLEEGILRRWCGLATIRVDSAGDHTEVDEKKSRDVLVPIVRQVDAGGVAKQVLPNLRELAPPWTRVSRLAIGRGCKKGWALITLGMLFLIPIAGWYCLLLIPAFPMVYFLNERWYHHTGYFVDDEHLLFRSGWWSRSTICVPTQNIQSLELTQNPFDRRLALATLQVDIAGQANTGGGPVIRNLPVEVARQMHRRLSEKAATTEFNW
ncbi:MAG: PH domain-containing protein, partial [Planctomycetota bacterium]